MVAVLSTPITPQEAHALARLRGNPEEPLRSADFRTEEGKKLAEVVASANGKGRPEAIDAYLATVDPARADEIRAALWSVSPDVPPDDEPVRIQHESAAFDLPALPADVAHDPDLAAIASPWLNAYEKFSEVWSPNGYEGFHAGVGVWTLSGIAARRVKLRLGGEQYTPLTVALAARSSLYAKTTTAAIGIATLRAAGLDWLLASDSSTPAKFVYDLAGHVPEDLESLPHDTQDRLRRRLAFAGQRAWFYEEFGQHVAGMMRADGPMGDFRGLLRRLDDCQESYESGTIARGSERIDRPYVALLANVTPADLEPHARRGSALWSDGLGARIAFVTPPPGAVPKRERFPSGERSIPSDLTEPLREWHERLGTPQLFIEGSGARRMARVVPPNAVECTLGTGVFDAMYGYRDALLEITAESENTDLDASYARFPTKALRVGMLLASLENGGRVEMKHWARGQAIAEDWRASLHALVAQLNTPKPSEARQREEDACRVVRKKGPSTAADVARYMHGASSGEVARVLDGLVSAGVMVADLTQKRTKRYALMAA